MFASDYRRLAREALRGRWRPVMGVMLLAQAVFLYLGLDVLYINLFARPIYFEFEGATYWFNSCYACTPVGAVGWVLLAVLLLFDCASAMVTVGQYRAMAGLLRGEMPAPRQLFPWGLFGKALLMSIVRGLLVFAWSMLFVIPGIIAVYRYSMADYLLAENPELGPVEALRESRRRMMGRKGGLFCLQMSFLGWALLLALVEMVLNSLLVASGAPGAAVWTGLIYTLCVWLLSAPLNAYMLAAQTAFFQNAPGAAQEQAVPTGFADEPREPFAPEPEAEPQQSFAEQSADEGVARDIYLQHGCSRNRLRMEGMLEEYEAYHPSGASEANWRREYGDALMRRFDRDPDALNELLGLCAEYADEQLANRILARIERHIRQQTLPDAEILNMAGRTLAVLTSGAFADEGFLARRREQISDMANRLEQRLREAGDEGEWRQSLALIRRLCGDG